MGSISIPVGATSAEFVVTAVADGVAEGPETLELAPSVGTGSGIITITDVPYEEWASVLGSGGLEDPTADFDGDGSSNIEEYAFNTDPTRASSRPAVTMTKLVGAYKVVVPLDSLPADLEVRAETSTDLVNWTETGVVELEDGFAFSAGDTQRYLRLVYELLVVAP